MPSWVEMTIEVPSEFGEVVASFLFDLGSPGLECSEREGITSLIAYFSGPPPIENLEQLCAAAGRRTGSKCLPVIRSRLIDEENWAQDWKKHFRPTAVGHRLLISPPWETPAPDDRLLIVIEPGMAFGTGQHPTTRGCLELIEEATAAGAISRALDVGTGSGILAIALAKLGVGRVFAVDNDPVACDAATMNSQKNGTEGSLCIANDWGSVSGEFDLIVANLFTNLLRDLANDFTTRLAPGGLLVCSGFLATDEATVRNAYPGFESASRREEDGWVALTLSRRSL